MSLLLQLNADLPEVFEGHERRLYLWICRGKTCRRKEGSVRGFRGVRVAGGGGAVEGKTETVAVEEEEKTKEEPKRVGETLFGVKPSAASGAGGNPFAANPFASSGTAGAKANPFAATSSLAAKPAQKTTPPQDSEQPSLPETFASKARISSSSTTSNPPPPPLSEPWPPLSSFPQPFPSQHLDAGAEYIDPTPSAAPTNIRVDDSSDGGGMGIKDAFESSMDKIFQKFADRLSQNPEQVLRYEYSGSPLLYSKNDAVGKALSPATEGKVGSAKGMPRCGNCGAERVFELQVTPQLIEEVEREDVGLDGMDWGTIILGTCKEDCCREKVGFVDEWVGVQWEESATHKRPV